MEDKIGINQPNNRIEEGNLYKAGISEDGEDIFVFNRYVVVVEGEVEYMKCIPGYFVDEDGEVHPNYNQRDEAEALIDRFGHQDVNLDGWELV